MPPASPTCPAGNGSVAGRRRDERPPLDGIAVRPDGRTRLVRSSSGRPSVDSPADPLLSFAPPVADWLAFLADLLAAEVLRDMTSRNDAA
jgi:hypothetical protein